MKANKKIQTLFYIEIAALLILLTIITYSGQDITAKYRLWEIFPAILAGTITTFGLMKMKKLT